MKKILIIKHGSLGDIIFALPAFESIKKRFFDARIDILTEEKYINFFNDFKIFDNFYVNNRNESNIKIIFILFKLLVNKYELIIDLQNSQRTTFYNLFFRIFNFSKISSSRPFAHYRYKIPPQGDEKVIKGLFNQLNLIGVKESDNCNYEWLKVKIQDKIKLPLVLLIPGVSKNKDYKQWPPDKFARLAEYFQEKGFSICVIGTKNDMKSIKPILKRCKNVLNKIDKSPPKIIYSLALKSSVIVTNDSGPGHLAGLSNNTLICLANDNKISSSNLPSGNHIYNLLSRSVKKIEVEQVIDLINKNKLI